MANFSFDDLVTKYKRFEDPILKIEVDGNDIASDNKEYLITDLEVSNTCEFEASMASFVIYNTYSHNLMRFLYKKVSKYCTIGSAVVISMGYSLSVREVFRGFISNISFNIGVDEDPGIRVTCMDVKGIMMSGNYSKQLVATAYSDAVKEILQCTVYEKLRSAEVITSMDGIEDTPDKTANTGGDKKASDLYIEMVAESDYEFVVKAAKKFNYEFFMIGGNVYFRPAKNCKDILIELSPNTGMKSIELEYDITGLVGSVEVRNMDVGTNDMFKEKQKLSTVEGKAKSLVSSIQKVYIDPTVRSKEDAKYRADYLNNEISYRFGTLHATFNGLPELTPGFFVRMKLIDREIPVDFYLTEVTHVMNDVGYYTTVVGKAAKMGTI